jgi:hypothetical protein
MSEEENAIKVHVSPELEYHYRDIANIFVGPQANEVVFEFGNRHLSMPGHITISNRVVMSFADAIELQQRLQQVLTETQQKMQQAFQQRLQEQQKAPKN